jgi:hypothetical protein
MFGPSRKKRQAISISFVILFDIKEKAGRKLLLKIANIKLIKRQFDIIN